MSFACSDIFAAATATNVQQNTVTMQKIAVQEQQLQQQMQSMQKEMNELQQEEAALNKQQNQGKTTTAASGSAPTPSSQQTTVATTSKSNKAHETAYQQNVHPVEQKVQNPNGTTTKVPYGGSTLANIGGFAVITSPYLHPQVQYSGGDLIVNYSSINKDAYMMQQRQQFQAAMASKGFTMPTSGSLLELSGEVEGDAVARSTFQGNKTQTDLYVGDAELDMQAIINRWLTAFMDFSYDNSPNDVGSRIGGSINLDNGFFTFGNLNVSKFRVTMGQLYVPFGQFNSYLISDPINKTLFRTKGQPIILGYGIPGENGFAGALYTFKGVSNNSGNADEINPYINQFGGDANYQFNIGKLQTTLGASYIANAADSYGMQFPGFDDPEFNTAIVGDGFSTSTETEHLKHTVPAVDLRGTLAAGPFSLIGEYDTVTKAFSPVDLSFDNEAASPSAYHVEGVYSFNMFTKPSTFSIGYDRSYEAMGLAVPQSRIAAAVNTSFWRNTVASLELRHDNAYSENDVAGGNGAVVLVAPDRTSSNTATLQFQVYF
jgi:hypothetical protein